MQQQVAAGRMDAKAAAASTAETAVTWVAAVRDVPGPKEIVASDAEAGAASRSSVASGMPQPGMQQQQQQQQQRRRRGGEPFPPSAGEAEAAAGVASRGWWRAAGPDHPHLRGVPEEFFRQQPRWVGGGHIGWLWDKGGCI
jgi:hypothetical protein